MYRKVLNELINWKNDPYRKPLILMGARQVGKTWILQEFGKKHYDDYIYINCDRNKQAEDLFIDFKTNRILIGLSAIAEKKIIPGKTLIILDEIQEIPAALTALKYFAEEQKDIHIAAAGSLLGLAIHKDTGFPVGKVNIINMYPMSFMEFLDAYGKDRLLNAIATMSFEELNTLHESLTDLLREYYFTGGMPEAVAAYIKTHDLKRVRNIQNEILTGYDFDIGKHAPNAEIPKIHAVLNSIPSQLAKENRKFIYGHIKTGARAATYENAIMWLCDAGIVHKVSLVTAVERPLEFYADEESFKLFPLDIGLLGAMVNAPAASILIGDDIFTEYKGSFTEAYVLEQMITTLKTPIYYHSRQNSTLKLDFTVEGRYIYPIEVKAETNLRAKSLSTILNENPTLKGIRFSMAPYKEQERMVNVPLPLVEPYMETI